MKYPIKRINLCEICNTMNLKNTLFKTQQIIRAAKLPILFLCLMVSQIAYSQSHQNEKRIYLLDVTASMLGKGSVNTPNIFDEVKQKLTNSINDIQSPLTEVVIIPFTDKPHEPIRGRINNRDSLINEINKIDVKRGDTNITDAWIRGVEEIDSLKINYMFLLTDGLHNWGTEKEALYETLKQWETFSEGKYMFAFYVMLTDHAKEMEIAKIVDETNQMWLIESMDVNVSLINSTLKLTANVNQNNSVKLNFTSSNANVFSSDFEFSIALEKNPYYELDNLTINFPARFAQFNLNELMPRIQIPLEKNLKLYIKYDKTKYPLHFFAPEIINFHVINKGVRTMNIREK